MKKSNPITLAQCLLALGLASLGSWRSACADVFHLRDGRVISGTIASRTVANVDDKPVRVLAVEAQPGVYVKILESDLVSKINATPTEADLQAQRIQQEYQQRVATMPQTADAHADLAAWCEATPGMRDLAKAHYLRAIDLDPDHATARAAVGYKTDENGRWVKLQQIMEKRGKVNYKGRWRFPEDVQTEIALEEAKSKSSAINASIHRWHNDVAAGNGARAAMGLENLSQINDPLAVPLLAELLLNQKKPGRKPTPPQLQLLYVRLLSQMPSPTSANALAHAAVVSSDQQVRTAALDALQAYGRNFAIPVCVSYLNNSNNELVNNAGEALGQLNATEALLPLIHALNTKHLQQKGGGNTTYSTDGIGFAQKATTVEVELNNPAVRGTLSQLTRQNFGFDDNAWMNWYASVYAAPVGDLRRDP